MHARSTTVWGDPQTIDAGVAYVRDEVLPAVRTLDGCTGLSMLVDRTAGRCIVTSAWQDEEAMHASDPGISPMRERAAQIFGGAPVVTFWEIAVLHRARPAPPTACTRVSWTRAEPRLVDRALEAFRMTLLPQLEELPGFCSVSLVLDRPTGRAAAAVTYDNRDALEASQASAAVLREQFSRRAGTEILEVADFELALAHLRVPETV